MDEHDVGEEQLRLVFGDINRSNNLLGGTAISMRAISSILKNNTSEPFSILDIGCGDGFLLRELADAYRKKDVELQLYGIDNSREAIELAQLSSVNYPEIKYLCMDILDSHSNIPACDLVISSLTMHHFSEVEIPNYLERCQDLARSAVIINDLQRSRLAYYLFKIFSAIFIKSAIAKQDGLISIRKGFRKRELVSFSKKLKNWKHVIRWKWAFRYVWVMEYNRLKA